MSGMNSVLALYDIFIDNAAMFVQIAQRLGIKGILHVGYESTRSKLASFGLQMDEGVTA